MKKIILSFMLFLSFIASSEVRIDTGEASRIQFKSDNLLNLIDSLRNQGFFNGRAEINRADLESVLDHDSSFITREGKRFIILDTEMIESIHFIDSNRYHSDNEF